jgi:hypothetical protein
MYASTRFSLSVVQQRVTLRARALFTQYLHFAESRARAAASSSTPSVLQALGSRCAGVELEPESRAAEAADVLPLPPPPPPPAAVLGAADAAAAALLLLLPPLLLPPSEPAIAGSPLARRTTALGGQLSSVRACGGTRRSRRASSLARRYLRLARGGSAKCKVQRARSVGRG